MALKTDTRPRGAASPKARTPARAPVNVKSNDPLYLQVVRALKEAVTPAPVPQRSRHPL